MIQLSKTILETLLPDADFLGGDFTFTGVATDSRAVSAGNLFVTWTGERCDGTQFCDAAVSAGACAVIADKPVDISTPQVITRDPIKALGLIAAYWRDQFDIPVIAVTGSNGKTTVKNLLRSIFNVMTDGHCLAPTKSYNNHVGVPLTLCQLDKTHKVAVIEMGMNHFGEIDYLTQIAKPDIALITNAYPNHTEFVHDVQGVASAKAEIFNGLKDKGMAVLNADDDFIDFWLERVAAFRVVKFGLEHAACVSAEKIQVSAKGVEFKLVTPLGVTPVRLPLLGKHNVYNALAAVAVLIGVRERFGWAVTEADLAKGLRHATAEPGRLAFKTSVNGHVVIDDTYNAGLASVLAAIEVLAGFKGKKVFVLGDLGELTQAQLESFYTQIADFARASKVDAVFTCGHSASRLSDAFSGESAHFTDKDKLVQSLKSQDQTDVTFLIKGSRFMKMETLVTALCE